MIETMAEIGSRPRRQSSPSKKKKKKKRLFERNFWTRYSCQCRLFSRAILVRKIAIFLAREVPAFMRDARRGRLRTFREMKMTGTYATRYSSLSIKICVIITAFKSSARPASRLPASSLSFATKCKVGIETDTKREASRPVR